MQAHFPSGCEITETPYDYTKSISLQELQSIDMDWITPELIKTVFKLFKSKKSPGWDQTHCVQTPSPKYNTAPTTYL